MRAKKCLSKPVQNINFLLWLLCFTSHKQTQNRLYLYLWRKNYFKHKRESEWNYRHSVSKWQSFLTRIQKSFPGYKPTTMRCKWFKSTKITIRARTPKPPSPTAFFHQTYGGISVEMC
jgi:hypothetical protein